MPILDWFGALRIGLNGRHGSSRRNLRRAAPRACLALETLEERSLLASYVISQLTFTGAGSFQNAPSISDDGTRIAFVSNADLEGSGRNAEHRPELFLYDAQTAHYQQITQGPGMTTEIDMSADGNRIAFVSKGNYTGNNGDGNSEIFLYDAAAGHFTQVTNTTEDADRKHLSINADGSRLAFQTFLYPEKTQEVLFYDAANPGLLLRHIANGADPSISADGSKIVFGSKGDLEGNGKNADGNLEVFVFDMSSNTFRQITDTQDATNSAYSIRGDGKWIALTSTADLAGFRLPEDEGLNLPYIYTDQGQVFTEILHARAGGLQFSSDGSRLGFVGYQFNLPVGVYDLYTNSPTILAVGNEALPVPDGSDQSPSLEPSVSLSGNGSRIAFVGSVDPEGSNPEGNYELFVATELLPPVAVNNNAQVDEDSSVVVPVLQNDSDPFGGPLELTQVTQPEHGLAIPRADGTVTYRPEPDFNGSDSFTYTVAGRYGFTSQASVFVTVVPVNDPIHISAPASAAVDEDTSLVFSQAGDNAISISDIDLGSYGTVVVTVTRFGGRVRLGSTTGIQGGTIDENTTYFVGNLSDVNNALDGLMFTPDENYNGPAAFELEVQDPSAGALDPGATDDVTVAITVKPVNDAPIISAPAAITIDEDAALVFSSGNGNAITLADVDAEGGDLKLTITNVNGVLVALGRTAGVDVSLEESTVTLVGALPALNSTLDGLTFRTPPNYNGPAGLELTLNDLGNTGRGGALSAAHPIDISVVAVNDPPVNTVPASLGGFEDVPLPIGGVSVLDVDATEGSGLLQMTLGIGHGTLQLNTDVPGGVTEAEVTGNGTGSVALTASQAAINATLGATDGLIYLPVVDFSGDDQLTVTTNDLGNAGTGGALSDTDTIAISIASADEQLADIRETVLQFEADGTISLGFATSLVARTDEALALLDANNQTAALELLGRALLQLGALRKTGRLGKAESQELDAALRTVLASIGTTGRDADTTAAAVDTLMAGFNLIDDFEMD